MPVVSLNETFDNEKVDTLLSWLNPPANWWIEASRSRLVVEPDGGTDFWQRTHYGFRAGNGHLLKAELSGDAVISSQIQAYPVHQYDQAGVMVWFSDDCWLKASVEFEHEGPSQLGAVATNYGFSDWSLQDFVPETSSLSYGLQIRRAGGDFSVEYRSTPHEPWKLIRLAHLSPGAGQPCLAGVYACSPKAAGFRAEFDFLTIDSRT